MNNHLTGSLSKYIKTKKDIGLVKNDALIKEMVVSSNHLIYCYLNNTYFFECSIQPEFANMSNLYTIFSRRDSGCIPYLVSDLSGDLLNSSVSRQTINIETEKQILSMRATLESLFVNGTKSIIVECSESTNYLILEGNKRITALHMNQDEFTEPINTHVGKTLLSWQSMLALHEMSVP